MLETLEGAGKIAPQTIATDIDHQGYYYLPGVGKIPSDNPVRN